MDNENLSNIWREPIDFKGIKLYPIKLKDCLEFYRYVGILIAFKKNQFRDIKIIKMNWLDFLLEMNKVYEGVEASLRNLLSIVFKDQDFSIEINEKGKHFIKVYPSKKILNYSLILEGKDFNKIREIILNQNLIQYDDTIVSKEFQKALDQAKEDISKQSKSATLEEQIIAYGLITKLTPNQIKEETLWGFYKTLERYGRMVDYQIIGAAMSTGMVEIKDPVHWLDHIKEKGLYDDVIMKDNQVDRLESICK